MKPRRLIPTLIIAIALALISPLGGGPARSAAQAPPRDFTYVHPVHRWAVTYPEGWRLDHARYVIIKPAPGLPEGWLGIHLLAGVVTSGSLDQVVDFNLRGWGDQMRADGQTYRTVSRRHITLADGAPAVEVVHLIGTGVVGRSRKIFVLAGELGFLIDAETHDTAWPALEPHFARIINSFQRGAWRDTGRAQPPAGGAAPTAPVNRSATVLIPGVPFIGWGEAAALEYHNKQIINPSAAAAIGMVLRHWQQDLALLRQPDYGVPQGGGGWALVDDGFATSLTDLKRHIDAGVPVVVFTALTPMAHTLSPQAFIMASSKDRRFDFGPRGLQSGVLGRMVTLKTFDRIEEASLKANPDLKTLRSSVARESMFDSAKVVIGYDDRRRVVVVHEPSFGPAIEFGYNAFEAMWGGVWRKGYTAARPRHPAPAGSLPPAATYPAPTPDQRATRAFVFGYAASSTGRGLEGEPLLARGLDIPGTSPWLRHLLLLELAIQRADLGQRGQAVALAEQAIKLLPEHHRPWQVLANALAEADSPTDRQKADEARRRAKDLCADPTARAATAKMLWQSVAIFGGC